MLLATSATASAAIGAQTFSSGRLRTGERRVKATATPVANGTTNRSAWNLQDVGLTRQEQHRKPRHGRRA